MDWKLIFALSFIFSYSFCILSEAKDRKNKPVRFTLTMEEARYETLTNNLLDYNITVDRKNNTFTANFYLYKSVEPIFLIQINSFWNKKKANLVQQSIEYCKVKYSPSPVGILLRNIISAGSVRDLNCPLALGSHSIKSITLPVGRLISMLPELTYEAHFDIRDKGTGTKIAKFVVFGRIKHETERTTSSTTNKT